MIFVAQDFLNSDKPIMKCAQIRCDSFEGMRDNTSITLRCLNRHFGSETTESTLTITGLFSKALAVAAGGSSRGLSRRFAVRQCWD